MVCQVIDGALVGEVSSVEVSAGAALSGTVLRIEALDAALSYAAVPIVVVALGGAPSGARTAQLTFAYKFLRLPAGRPSFSNPK